jgi:hypothetical protein
MEENRERCGKPTGLQRCLSSDLHRDSLILDDITNTVSLWCDRSKAEKLYEKTTSIPIDV